jgi:hypothetical protein
VASAENATQPPVLSDSVRCRANTADPNIGHGLGTGNTSERGADSAEVHTRAIFDRDGRMMVLITHNTDLGDSWEREADDPTYFYKFAANGYAFGINVVLYALTH